MFAVIYRSERKLILHNQLELVNYVIRVVEDSDEIQKLWAKNVSIEQISSTFKQMYMAPTEKEQGQINENGDFKDDDGVVRDNGFKSEEFKFMYRRQYMCGYLSQIFNLNLEQAKKG